MAKLILEHHHTRRLRPDDDNALILLFQFSLRASGEGASGEAASGEAVSSPRDVFWTEARLQEFLASKPGWASVSAEDREKVLFRFVQEQIAAAGRKLRQCRLSWSPGSPHASGPAESPASIQYPDAPPVTVDTENREASRFGARAGAGL